MLRLAIAVIHRRRKDSAKRHSLYETLLYRRRTQRVRRAAQQLSSANPFALQRGVGEPCVSEVGNAPVDGSLEGDSRRTCCSSFKYCDTQGMHADTYFFLERTTTYSTTRSVSKTMNIVINVKKFCGA